MPFCPKCESEFRPGFMRCEECDVVLVDMIPAPPKRPHKPAYHTVYQTTELADAETIRLLLEGRGFHADVQGYNSAIGTVGMPTSAAPLTVIVPAQDAQGALEVIRETQGIRSARTGSNRRRWWVAAILEGGPIVPILTGVMALLRRIGLVSKR